MAADFREGNILVWSEGDLYRAYKVLRVDDQVYHVLAFAESTTPISIVEVPGLPIRARHLPIQNLSGCRVIGTQPVQLNELDGYFAWLKFVDFRKFVGQTGVNTDELMKSATEAFNRANDLKDAGRAAEAIDEYSSAFEFFPLFYEAIDSRAFAKMDLALWDEAIADFELSRTLIEQTHLTEFSIGECYLKLGYLHKAREQFLRALRLEPANRISQEFLTRVESEISKATGEM